MQHRIETEYPRINLLVVPDTRSALQAVSTGAADGFIGNLAVGTHIIQEFGLSNVKVVAPTPFENHTQAFGVRNDWQELASILSKGISGFSPEERSAIKHKWLSVRYEFGIQQKDVIKWVVTVSSVLGSILLLILFWNRKLNQEIQERQQVEQHLRESESKYRCLSEASFEGILLLHDQVIIYANRTMAKMFGYRGTDELIGKKVTDLIDPHDREEASCNIVGNVEQPCLINGFKKDGTIFPIEAHGRLFVFGGSPVRVTAIRDLTEKKKAEDEIKKLQGIIPICMHCKGIRDDEGYWKELEQYISEHSEARFSHGVCDHCLKKYYPELDKS